MKKLQPNADYDKVTMVGHSMGGDISMYFAREYPDEIKKVVTLDNLRVPFLTDGKFKILSFRSKDTHFKPDPGVVPDDDQCEQAGITVVNTGFQHNDMRDTGPDAAKSSIQSMLDKFLDDSDKSAVLKPVPTKMPDILAVNPGPVPLPMRRPRQWRATRRRARPLRTSTTVVCRCIVDRRIDRHSGAVPHRACCYTCERSWPANPSNRNRQATWLRRSRRCATPAGAGGADHRPPMTSLPSSPKRARCRRTRAGARGRLVFALDATMSRQPTWDMACALQADMFREAARSAASISGWSIIAASTSAAPPAGSPTPRNWHG